MILLIDIGNTHTHLGLAHRRRVVRQVNLRTADWFAGRAQARMRRWVGCTPLDGAALCSVVPRATRLVKQTVRDLQIADCLELNFRTITGLDIDYPRPQTIGADRLANAVAARHLYGVPVVVLDFGTAVTFDVVDSRGCYIGGVIAPGLSAMTDYLHEHTALLPRVRIRECKRVIGRSTEEAMLAGAVHGYRGLIRELLRELKRELGVRRLTVVATGGYARLMASKLPEIGAVKPDLTLEGLRLVWAAHAAKGPGRARLL